MTMADIRALEEETKAKLDEERNKVWRHNQFGMFDQFDFWIFQGEIKGTAALEK
jgi:hypothetical protein